MIYRRQMIRHTLIPSTVWFISIKCFQLASPIQFTSTQKAVKLPTRNIVKDDDVVIAAWGSMSLGGPIHNNLQKLYAKVMLPGVCQNYHRNFMRIAEHELCTLITYGTGLCHVCSIILCNIMYVVKYAHLISLLHIFLYLIFYVYIFKNTLCNYSYSITPLHYNIICITILHFV